MSVIVNGMLQSPYAQLLAATTLTKLISRPNVTLPLEQRIDIRMYNICHIVIVTMFYC